MAYETIEFKLEAGIARLTLNRPDRLNSFTVQMHEEVADALGKLGDARTLILTGAGRGFCAGQDLNDRAVAPGQAVDLGELVEQRYNPLIRTLTSLPMPVIARVNGVAAGAGANIALACDIVIAAKSAKFIQSFAAIGLIPDSGGTWVLPRLVGQARALGPGADRRAAGGGARGGMGPDLEGGRRRAARRRGRRARRALRRRADQGAGADQDR